MRQSSNQGDAVGHWEIEVNGAALTPKVRALALRPRGESITYEVGVEAIVVPMVALTDDQSRQSAMLPFASVLIRRASLPPAPKSAVDPATTYPPSDVC